MRGAVSLLGRTDAALAERLRLGDASLAAPFTLRAPSVAGCLEIVRHGRGAAADRAASLRHLAVRTAAAVAPLAARPAPRG